MKCHRHGQSVHNAFRPEHWCYVRKNLKATTQFTSTFMQLFMMFAWKVWQQLCLTLACSAGLRTPCSLRDDETSRKCATLALYLWIRDEQHRNFYYTAIYWLKKVKCLTEQHFNEVLQWFFRKHIGLFQVQEGVSWPRSRLGIWERGLKERS